MVGEGTGPPVRGITIVGAGRVGLSLAADLAADGSFGRVAVAGHGSPRPTFLDRVSGVDWITRPTATGPVLLFAVPDDALPDTVRAWARVVTEDGGGGGPDVVLHTSGARDAAILGPLVSGGAAAAAWHPLVALAEPARNAFRDVSIGLEGDEEAVRFGERLAERIGGRPIRLEAGGRAAYHAAAVFASNYLVSCLGVAVDLLREASDGAVGESDLVPLARSAVANVGRYGLERGATGPLSRGDLGTIDAHLAALDPPRAALYRALGRELLRIVRDRLDPEAAADLGIRLSEGP